MTDLIEIPSDQPDASYAQLGKKFYGIYRLPHGSWRELLGRHGERLAFASAQEATRAAFAKVNSILFATLRSSSEPSTETVGARLAKEAAPFRSKNARLVRRGAGKKPFVVETKRGR